MDAGRRFVARHGSPVGVLVASRVRHHRQTLLVLVILAAGLAVTGVTAERERAKNQAAYDAFLRTGVTPVPPKAVSGATLTVQERL